jgi:hypothetical protein
MLEFEYARAALRNGLKLEQELGVNPYKFGMIGSATLTPDWLPSTRITFGEKLPTSSLAPPVQPIPGSRQQTR